MKKRLLSVILVFSIVFCFSIPSFASSPSIVSDYATLNQLSEIYQIPLDVLRTLSPEQLKNMEVSSGQKYYTHEEYIKFIENKDGNVIAVPGTFQQFKAEQNMTSPYASGGATDESSGWMKVYVVIIDDPGRTARISGTFTWLDGGTRYRMTDVIGIAFQNGTYVTGSANGFYSYKPEGVSSESITLNNFATESSNFRIVKSEVPMRTDVNRSDEVIYMGIEIYKNVGAQAEIARAIYGHQIMKLDLASLINAGLDLLSAITFNGDDFDFLPKAENIVGSFSRYYESASSEVSVPFSD